MAEAFSIVEHAEVPADRAADELAGFLARHSRTLVLTGAGLSTASGIPDYRDLEGGWKRPQPVTFQAFTGEDAVRRRYWARSLVGWPRFGHARPNATHAALAQLEARGQVELLLTQNVDRLHQAAGSAAVIDLHGRLDVVRCMECERRLPREDFQQQLLQRNPHWATLQAVQAAEGDVERDLAHQPPASQAASSRRTSAASASACAGASLRQGM